MNTIHDIRTLEDATSAFIQSCEAESEDQFEQSDICAAACTKENRIAWGMDDEAILAHIGKQSKRGRTTMYARLLVGRVFPPEKRNGALYWSIHEVCAHTWSEDDPEAPYAWLEYAADNDLSVRQLRQEIAAANGTPPEKTKPVYVLKEVGVTVDSWDMKQLTVFFDEGFEPPVDEDGEIIWPTAGLRLIVTAVKEADPYTLPAETGSDEAITLGEGVQTSEPAVTVTKVSSR